MSLPVTISKFDSDMELALEEVRALSPEEAVAEIKREEEERLSILNGLAKKIEGLLQERANARVIKDGEWDSCYKLYHAPLNDGDNWYSDDPFKATAARKRPTPNIVRTKADTAVANSVAMQFSAGEKNWDIFPPANSNDPLTQQRCRLMSQEIQAQLDACNYPIHARRAIEDRVILGTGVLKGPVNTGRMRTKYVQQGDTWVPEVVQDKTPSIEHVPLWRFYPDMNVANFSESVDAIQLHPKTAMELSLLKVNPGFDKSEIDKILNKEEGISAADYNDTYLNKFSSRVWGSTYMYKDRYTVIEYHGPVSYDEVAKLGLVPTYESPTAEYYGEVWVCCGRVIRMELENIEAQFETPYSVSVWKRDPTSIFGYGLPLILGDAQRVVTQSYHMILDNASLTSGPQVALYQQYIQPIDGKYELSPNKVWLLTDPQYGIKDAIDFFYPPNVIGNIMPVLQLARQFADEESAVASPMGSSKNADSATGQLIDDKNSTTLLDFFAEEWDDQVTEKIIRRMYGWNMQYNPREDIKGDYIIDVKSSSEYKNKQIHIRDLERLSMEVAQNPSMALWINQDQLAVARLSLMSLPSNKIVRSPEEYAAAAQQQAQQPNPQMIELEIKQKEAEREDRRLALQEAELQFEMKQAQQREIMEFQEKMGSNQARLAEAQASVLRVQGETQIELIKLAAKDKQLARQMEASMVMKENDNQAKVFIKAMEQTREDRRLSQVDKELELKAEIGTGI